MGGGIFSGGSTLTVTASTLSGNAAEYGGGIYSIAGALTVDRSTLFGNAATRWGGAIYSEGILRVIASTLSGNGATDRGGGVFNARTATLMSTIVANSYAGGDCFGPITDADHNLDSDGSCGLQASNSLPRTNPMLGPLADNGGPTHTMVLLPGSPLIDAIPVGALGGDGVTPLCPSSGLTDQRGVARPLGVACDTGAFETWADAIHPDVWITSPPDGASYTVGQAITAAYACDDTGGSLLASCVGTVGATPVASGDPIPTGAAGSFALTVTATDGAGNVTTQTRSYGVFPALGGPVDTGTMNVGKAGSKIPFMFSLGADYGLGIFAEGYPKSRPMTCDTGLPSDPIESTVSTPGGLRYDAATGTYHYTWATERNWAGSCRQLILRFAASGVGEYSGGEIVFAFKFR